MADWNVEGGFYEQRSGQGEDPWADMAEFDTISAPSQDVKESEASVSWGSLTAAASYAVKPFEKPNS